MSIDIPIGHGGEVLEVSRRDLKENESFVFSILNDEAVPLWVYVDIALEYWKQGLRHQFEEVVRTGLRRAPREAGPVEQKHQVLLLNLLASYYIETAKSLPADSEYANDNPDRLTANQCILQATELLNEALSLDNQDVYAIVASGNIRLVRREYDEASNSFQGALSRDSTCVPALLGEASVRCLKGDFDKALELYQKVLSIKPDLQPDVRVPIGICYYKLGATTQSRKALERALQLDPNNADALILLAILDWNVCRGPEAVSDDKRRLSTSANAKLLKVYRTNKRHPLLACQMAYRKLLRKEYTECIRYADMVLQRTDVTRLRAEGLTCKARALQAMRKYNEALQLFEKAAALDPSSVSILYGLAAMQIFKGQTENACQTLERILQKEPQNTEAMMRLVSLYAQMPTRRTTAVELFDKFSRSSGGGHSLDTLDSNKDEDAVDDPNVLIDVGRALESASIKRSASLYRRSLEKLQARGIQIPPELYNNMAVLHQLLAESTEDATRKSVENIKDGVQANGSTDANSEPRTKDELLISADKFYNLALSAANQSDVGDGFRRAATMTKATVQYNQARLLEAKGELRQAVDAYKQILEQYPAYTDARLRLGAIYCDEGRFEDALEHFKLVADADPQHAESRLLIGRACSLAGKRVEAKRAFDSVLKSIDNQNIYALCALGNVQVGLARSAARQDPKERDELIVRAHRLYDAALKHDPKCVQAAIGMGILFTEVGQLRDAYTIFSQVEQATGDLPSAALNLAHILLALDEKDAKIAIPLYEKALKKGFGQDSYVLQSLARAYYILARERKDDAAMHSALQWVQKAAKLNPSDAAIFFNLALVKQHMAVVLNDQPIERRNLAAMHRATEGIETAEKIFTALASRDPEHRPNYNITHAMHRKTYCKDVRKLSEKKIHETATLERQREERKERIREEQRLREEQKLQKEREEQELRRHQEEERERRRAEIQAKLQEDMARSRQLDEEEKEMEVNKRKSKGSKRVREVSPSDSDNEPQKNDKRRRMRKKADQKRANTADDSDGELNEVNPSRTAKRVGIRSNLSSEFVEDSEDEEEVPNSPKRQDPENSGEDDSQSGSKRKRVAESDQENAQASSDERLSHNGTPVESEDDDVHFKRPRLSKGTKAAVEDSEEEA
ncbi:uncharacterized protein SPPG_00223 [Spizellomyces punctatus DAOM BR117]|uniref:Uncharacterized protein n=1 Tax=Spizellomyces punctatus (strain DAOM BR117) TaxID=645134 RepID=A0A0L0HUB7_SPIPD|nr:uncharacterized protein SPPG_00223 [Spizellomyces punctatus DAOM BR117]KND04495.1 hypothetical protein SPPG_00223 [Spizellomyces punctatus DAOM BR117]|eukprot:XP_016612534.1 hypothetical protein SPPG_00223 [Spizellomyces punctatus DAOM BR117]